MTRFTACLCAIALVFLTGCPPDDPAVVEPDPETVVEVAERAGLSTFVSLVDAAGMRNELSADGPFTVFGPSDEAFDALDQATLDALRSPENQDALRDLISYHVVPDSLRMADFEAEQSFTTLEGEDLTVTANDEVTVTDAVANTADVQPVEHEADNGFVYVIEQVLFHTAPEELVSPVEDPAEDPVDPMGEPDLEVDPDPDPEGSYEETM